MKSDSLYDTIYGQHFFSSCHSMYSLPVNYLFTFIDLFTVSAGVCHAGFITCTGGFQRVSTRHACNPGLLFVIVSRWYLPRCLVSWLCIRAVLSYCLWNDNKRSVSIFCKFTLKAFNWQYTVTRNAICVNEVCACSLKSFSTFSVSRLSNATRSSVRLLLCRKLLMPREISCSWHNG